MKIALFTLGGTIAMSGHGRGVVARLTGADLVDAVPGLAETGVSVDIHDVNAVPSANLTFAGVLDVVRAAGDALRSGAGGVVVTQGTDTLEETAYLVDLVWPHGRPFVLTGAMRNPTLAGPDGPANLLDAVRVAADPGAHGLGAVVVMADEIHAARHVRKNHATSTGAFASPNAGPIGHLIEGNVVIVNRPPRRAALSMPSPEALAACRVPLHTVTLDDDCTILDHLVESAAPNPTAPTLAGLVVAGFGVGHVPAHLVPALETLADRVPVVLTSRTGAGSVLRHTYGAVGGEADLQRRGLINGGLLDPYKARVLLRLLLAGGADRDAVRTALAERG